MSATIIDGKTIAAAIRAEARDAAEALRRDGVEPCLAAVLVGDDPASRAYIGTKERACAECGIRSILHTPDAGISEADLLALVDELNADSRVHGILVQLPLPAHIDEDRVIERIDPGKDVDGFHPTNVGRLVIGLDTLRPCTPAGIPELIARSGLPIEGQHAVILGRSNIVGKPAMNILVQKAAHANATVTVCHSGTRDLAAVTRLGDILVAAIGRPQFVTADMVKPGATVIDVGINRVEDASAKRGYRLVGDVDFESVKDVAGAITPVPGGVGPMTVAMLMANTVKATRMIMARRQGNL